MKTNHIKTKSIYKSTQDSGAHRLHSRSIWNLVSGKREIIKDEARTIIILPPQNKNLTLIFTPFKKIVISKFQPKKESDLVTVVRYGTLSIS